MKRKNEKKIRRLRSVKYLDPEFLKRRKKKRRKKGRKKVWRSSGGNL